MQKRTTGTRKKQPVLSRPWWERGQIDLCLNVQPNIVFGVLWIYLENLKHSFCKYLGENRPGDYNKHYNIIYYIIPNMCMFFHRVCQQFLNKLKQKN